MTTPSPLPRKSPSQERSRRTVERILEVAAHIFQEQGYTGTTTNAIADEAQVSIGSLYQYFPNKDAILVALARRHIESTTEGLAQLLEELNPTEEFDVLLRTVVDFLVEQHEFDELHLLVMHAAPRTQDLSQELERAKTQLVDLTAELLSARFADSEQRFLVARMVVATIDAGVHDVVLRQPCGSSRQKAIDLTISTARAVLDDSVQSDERNV